MQWTTQTHAQFSWLCQPKPHFFSMSFTADTWSFWERNEAWNIFSIRDGQISLIDNQTISALILVQCYLYCQCLVDFEFCSYVIFLGLQLYYSSSKNAHLYPCWLLWVWSYQISTAAAKKQTNNKTKTYWSIPVLSSVPCIWWMLSSRAPDNTMNTYVFSTGSHSGNFTFGFWSFVLPTVRA